MTEALNESGSPLLYSFRRCPYAMRARMALKSSRLRVELREVVLRDKPAHMLEISPKGTVPVLQFADGRVLEESLEIMDWALGESDPEGWLDGVATAGAEWHPLILENDGSFKHHLDRYKYAQRYEDADPLAHREGAEVFLKKLEARLSEQAYLSGPKFGYCDAAIAPFIRQFANAGRAWFDQSPYPHLRGWLGRFLQDERFTSVMAKIPQWTPDQAARIWPD